MRKILVKLLLLVAFSAQYSFAEEGFNYQADSLTVKQQPEQKQRKGLSRFIHNVIGYFEKANVPHPEKKFDISFIGGPHYSSETGFGIGAVGSGVYYAKRDSAGMPDKDTPASNFSVKIDVTTGQLYKFGFGGYHIFEKDRYRINYDAYFYSFKDKYWGIGYKNGIDFNHSSSYNRLQAQIKADFLIRANSRFYFGPLAQFSFIRAEKIQKPTFFEGEPLKTLTSGIGLTAVFDSRDVPFNAYKGVYFRVDQLFNPRFLGNKQAFSQTELTLNGYGKVWKGGVLAAQFHTNLTYGNTPWGLLPTFGGTGRMRGYYEGRFRDKCEMDVTLEMRQHVWRRNGLVLWVGAGSVFSKLPAFNWTKILPNAGIGYRWQFKPRVNVRLDIGVGKGETGFNFSINEAF